jgi:ankyrin repeat protein
VVQGRTAVIWAAYYGDASVVEAVLEAGADINAADNDVRRAELWGIC